ncbi:voltage-dependent T-type calcium channel subunit alpha-1H isoform X2 [Coccinella septempunctata]|uniref:voltage-dependent T-type calcium channel subunit alpha-1H isoform X2 n=1 Tax=Coccinella septempunctata TaxID=41139 RepID=UPI001D073232|nr:voltage-dependent T-type calcium channel subunit alpha-1H isoform X2 [Coccinella septempunctata]
MHYCPSTAGYAHCRSGSDIGLNRRGGSGGRRREQDFDSADSTLSEESESGSAGSCGIEIDPNLPYPGIAPIALRYLSQTTRPRSWCLALISNPWFERVSMMVILLNCITLGMYQPCVDDKCKSNRCKILQVFDDFIFAFFSLEMTIKMIAMGVYGRGSYLADSWNRLDLFIVLSGAIEYALHVDNLNLSAVRTIRVLRPLRAINRIPSMRILVMLLLDTLPMLGNVLLLCFFVFFIFGIVGVQLWNGVLRQRCTPPTHIAAILPMEIRKHEYKIPEQEDYICSNSSGMHTCTNLIPYILDGRKCNLTYEEKMLIPEYRNNDSLCINWHFYYTECMVSGTNPFKGTISFDNIGLAWVSIFLVISLEGWTEIMYYVQDGHSFWDWIYFVLLIVIGSFFMINLCLVVIATQFSETKKREMERMRLERARFQSSSTLASSTNNSEPTSCYAEIVKYIAHLWRRTKRKAFKKIRLWRMRRDQGKDQKIVAGETIRLNSVKKHHPNCYKVKQLHQQSSVSTNRTVSRTSSICLHEYPAKENRENKNNGEDYELPTVSKRPGLLRIPSISNQDVSINNESSTNLLAPSIPLNNRRRSSVMFSDVILRHGDNSSPPSSSANLLSINIDRKNVCQSEKTTQTGDGDIWQVAPIQNSQMQIQNQQQSSQECCNIMNGETMTCQELLALVGGMNAALPTGPIVLDTFFSSLSNGINRQKSLEESTYSTQFPEEDYSCCQDLWHCEAEYRNETRSRCYICSCMVIKGTFKFARLFRKKIKLMVEWKYFQQGILLAILINTFSMGIEYHEQPEILTHVVEVSNIIFSAIFAVEMLLKIIAEGPFGYISNGFNVFDGVIVILSAIEIFQKFMGESHMDSGLSVLRTFRLLRILKLVRFMPNLRRQLFVMLRTMDNVAIFFSLLILFIFIFSILGMNIFGCKFCEDNGRDEHGKCILIDDDNRDRKNFDSLLWALVTVFQILTQEDWNLVLSNGMSKTSHWAALYFVALMTFGNYVLFNLLVAILVEGFSAERNERREREQRELARRKMSSILEASLRSSSDESNKSLTSSSGSYIQESKNCWRSAEELRKYKDVKDDRSVIGLSHCDCRDRAYDNSCFTLDPKCNIQKESMLKQPRNQQTSPPIITHTAATPEDSPSTNVEDFPEFRYNITTPNEETCEYDASTGDFSSNESSQKTTSLSLLKPPSLSPPPLTFRHFDKSQEDVSLPPLAGKIVIHNEKIGSKTMTFSEKVIIPNTPASCKTGGEKGKIQRKCSWKLSSRPSLRRKKCRNNSTESETVPLNNGRDHSQCNGGGVNRNVNLRNDSLLRSTIRIKNDTQRDAPNNKNLKGISPQNSIRCRSNTCSSASQVSVTPTLTRHNNPLSAPSPLADKNAKFSPKQGRKSSVGEPKAINTLNEKLITDRTLPTIKMEDCSVPSDNPDYPSDRLTKFFLYFEPTASFMKEREDYALYLFPSDSGFRQWCQWFIEQKWFDNVVLLFIALNCITLAMERPNIPPTSRERVFLSSCNYIFTVVFTAEMFIKVVAAGMCYGPNAYFTSGWNIMDGALVIISIVDLLMSFISSSSPRIFGILRVFRLLRSLRPLRVINRAPGLKLVVQTLLSSLRPIGNIVLICCTFFIIFGILGVQLFKGTFYHCTGKNIQGVQNKSDCLSRESAKWENEKYNFDDLGQALMSLFVLSSRDGWVNIMYSGLDAVGVDQQPKTNYSEWRLLYFISFILLVGFFVLNMFVGVVVENFHRCREEQEKEERVRRAAKRALQLEKRRRKMNEPPYYINYPPWRLFIHGVVTSKYFDLAIAAVIGLNVVTMATERFRMPDFQTQILKIFNYFFTAVFIVESSMKLIALGLKLYMKDKWNQLDVAIVILSVVGIVLEELGSNIIPINPTVVRVMRVMRIARVLKLLKMAKGIRALLDTVMQALPQVGNLGLLFFLLFFIFAALGVELFGRLSCEIEAEPCQGLGEHAHFKNFGMAFLTLFRVATGDNWNGIMKDTLRDETCSKDADCVTNCCVSHLIAPIFFVVFVLMAQFVLVNVVVAVLMKHLEESHKHLEEEQDLDNQLEREKQEKQEMEERRELCLALQIDQENQQKHKPLTKVLSLPSNFIYNPSGSKPPQEKSSPTGRRQTMHSHHPFLLSNVDNIKNIDESASELFDISEHKAKRDRRVPVQTSLDGASTFERKDSVRSVKSEGMKSRQSSETDGNLLSVTMGERPTHRRYGSTKNLFVKQFSMDVSEETPFLGGNEPETVSLTIIKHDSQESVERIIQERRKIEGSKSSETEDDIYDHSCRGVSAEGDGRKDTESKC